MDAAGITILLVNVATGLVGARMLARLYGCIRPGAVRACLAMFLGVYVMEACAVAASMMTMILPVLLAFFWGRVFGLWLLRSGAPDEYTHRAASAFAVYTGLPALSLVLVPIVAAITGKNIISAAEGTAFGIPSFIPWPFCSILGFFGIVSVGAFALIVIITIRGIRYRLAAG